ncbi:16S rRNA (adenine(1518)-N(6)/adenine(1519)-N(6))-dimethyltransferase RsmA [Trueperella pecoris]|uniref:Ribosomal RNA small subunit methyltransferase A n=1 Tax=Trueperella pecoris TaxID=2733571 RepID=A0A7M1QT67_9ACTO|nr:16S rRNA (adenine(1518)-N(6)/adenine(1519)-N(6))-dimethyltransferase RsmA [Trueperella pecoris]QOQ38172.1 16S rRNA (adenine(1518)-N(6)/adenine(1519)-N(6))-dimethyltransferase RsmA [Trueperella pecoris]QOR45342.1 16S rRNA (adenine(1518)-N(6)/adenine(1519)-N(6))-dimethyltransferase RsmA [Trueperella pecoris]
MALLTPVHIRELADQLGIRPTKTLGQNFVHDAGTVRRIVRDAGVSQGDLVLEVGPGLGSLTLAILEAGAVLSAIEIDPPLAAALPSTIEAMMPEARDRFAVLLRDALKVRHGGLAVPALYAQAHPGQPYEPTHLVANLPYNVAVPVILTLLEELASLRSVTVMVQLEVADRLAAEPGSRVYGAPSAKANWYADVRRGAKISRNVFWPVPNVDSALVHFDRPESARYPEELREATFDVVDAAFAQRRKTLRGALASWAGSPAQAEAIVRGAGVDPTLRGERLSIEDFVKIASAAR